MNTVWILVCDAARARLFEVRNNEANWNQLETFAHGESRAKSSDLMSDNLGQRSAEGAGVHHGALAPSSFPKEVEKGHFCHTLATMLDQAQRSHRFDKWVLVAPPHFLGMLKKEVTTELHKRLMATVDKDLNHMDAKALAERLRETVQLPLSERDVTRPSTTHSH